MDVRGHGGAGLRTTGRLVTAKRGRYATDYTRVDPGTETRNLQSAGWRPGDGIGTFDFGPTLPA